MYIPQKKMVRNYFSNVTNKGTPYNKEFWKLVKPFFSNKDCLSNSGIKLVDKDEIINKEKTKRQPIALTIFSMSLSEGVVAQSPMFQWTTMTTMVNIMSEHKKQSSILSIKSKMRFKKLNSPTNPFCLVTTDRVKSYLQAREQLLLLKTDEKYYVSNFIFASF